MATTMQAWQYSSTAGGLEQNLKLNTAVQRPTRMLSQDGPRNADIVVEVLSTAINPADYKVPEMGLIVRAAIPTPATPCQDFCGRITATGSAVDKFRVGEVVFGKLATQQHGTLGQFIVTNADALASLPEGVGVDDAATVGTAGLTAYQAVVPYVKEGNHVFIHGGAGGVGTFAIQFAKVMGCHVTVSASTPKLALCKELGADEVIDYRTTDVSAHLKSLGQVFSLVVDNVGSPTKLYRDSNDFLIPSGHFIQVGSSTNLSGVKGMASRMLVPGFLGGGKRSFKFMVMQPNAEQLVEIGKWMQEGKVKVPIDRAFAFEEAPQAFTRLKSGETAGKIVVHVGKKA